MATQQIVRNLLFTLSVFSIASNPIESAPYRKCNERRQAVPFIVNGTKADITDHPYQLSVGLYYWWFGDIYEHHCGGSIISNKWGATAAHCYGSDFEHFLFKFYARAGSSKYESPKQERHIIRFIVHPRFDSNPHVVPNCDVALLEFEEPFDFGPTIQPIKLTSVEPPVNTTVIVSGWGFEREEANRLSKDLNKVMLKIIPREMCFKIYNPHEINITNSMLCTYEKYKDACQGDSGGPVVAPEYGLVGIVSFGVGCGNPDFPGVNTNVASVRQWIKEISGV